MSTVTRFAPSPTGLLHLGSAFSALLAWRRARTDGGRFLLRIEDIDASRCRPELEAAILEDLAWLGLDWDGPVRRQSDHLEEYRVVVEGLRDRGLVYPCFCTRTDIAREIAAATSAPHGPGGPLYPGTCRALSASERDARIARGDLHCLRLDAARASAAAGTYRFSDETTGEVSGDPMLAGDAVLARRDTPTSYHLAVTVDDALQGVTLVTRGVDLLPSTHLQVLLQRLLGYKTPRYAHHRLIVGPDGRRFAKRDRSSTIADLRAGGRTPAEVRAMVGF
ncbi:MAG: tRNA glutamyl-Q(34) synthetase GluQRS [Alphaproteobacteria bacterium]|nr:tRNA glutamyl-Q(34) synthetase GluQRS [Alphaproteobacteria bacterium]